MENNEEVEAKGPQRRRGRPKGAKNKTATKKKAVKKAAEPKTNGAASHAPNSNGYDPDVIGSIVEEVKSAWDDLDTLRAEFMNKCKEPNARIKEIKAAAKENHGIPAKALNEFLKDEADLRKIVKREEKRRAEADGVEDEVDAIRLAAGQLADLPFGEWLNDQVS